MAAKIDIAEFARRVNPYGSAATDDIYRTGNAFANPGSYIAPGSSMAGAVSGDVPNVGGGFANSVYSSLMEEPSQYGVPHNIANTFIQASYPIIPFKDGSEDRIMEYQCVFMNRHHDKKYNLYAMANIGKFNDILRQAHAEFKKDLAAGIQDATTLRNFLRDNGEGPLERYHHLKHTGSLADINALKTAVPNVDTAYEIAMKDVYCYQTRVGILHRWNFLGVVLSKQQATSLKSIDLTPSTDHVNVVNVVVGEKARTANIFGKHGDVVVGGKVWLILKRAKGKDGVGYAQYQVEAYATNKRETVPYALRYYEYEEKEEQAHCWKLGTVTDWGPGSPPEGMRVRALGLGTFGEQAAYEATAQLPHIYLQLGI